MSVLSPDLRKSCTGSPGLLPCCHRHAGMLALAAGWETDMWTRAQLHRFPQATASPPPDTWTSPAKIPDAWTVNLLLQATRFCGCLLCSILGQRVGGWHNWEKAELLLVETCLLVLLFFFFFFFEVSEHKSLSLLLVWPWCWDSWKESQNEQSCL